jgi:hypothetical protein
MTLDSLRPLVSRVVIGPAAVLLANYLQRKFGLTVDSTQLQTVIDLAVYGLAHKLFDKSSTIGNPGDSASTHLAVAEASEAAALKAGVTNYRG